MGIENIGINLGKEEYPPLEPGYMEGAGQRQERFRLSVEEILGQLTVTKDKYEAELENLTSVASADREWLAAYQEDLINWINDIRMKEGIMKRGNEDVLDEVERRLFLLSEALEPTIH